jgi:hypothetical protein
MDKREQADFVYKTLFIDHTPISESCRGVLTALGRMGAPVGGGLDAVREYLARMDRKTYLDRVFELTRVGRVIMTNDPSTSGSARCGRNGYKADPRFVPALRLDGLLTDRKKSAEALRMRGYNVTQTLNELTCAEITGS